ncbi:MAG: hypothetical protein OEQ39_20885 [Gammaproteobacteria bacterium]|nr:hypothetical protein [Gammaproteobacteria bacterium]
MKRCATRFREHKSTSPVLQSLLQKVWIFVLAILYCFPDNAFSEHTAESTQIYLGHYSKEGNDETSSRTVENNTYIKLFKDHWIVMLYVPYPYASTVDASAITKVLERAKGQAVSSSYIRGKFGHLSELATAHVEKYGVAEDRIVFECGSLAPCTIKLGEDFLELIRPGVINEHIIKYNHVAEQ